MKNLKFIIISVLSTIAFVIWFSCNPFQDQSNLSKVNYDVLDASDLIKATGVGAIGWGEGTTGGTGGATINVTTKAALETAANQSGAAIIIIQNNLLTGEGMMDVAGNKTIKGAGSGVKLNFGFNLKGNNIIIQNLDMMNGGFNDGDSEGLDCISATGVQNLWVDHCTLHEAMDGLIDPTKGARFVTISNNYIYHQKTGILIGASDSDSAAESAQASSDKSQWHYTVTMYNNYIDGNYERSPRVRYGAVHMFNNYIANCPTYAVGKGVKCNIYSENNYFFNTTEVWHAWDSSSKPGYIEDVGSLFEGNNGNTADFPPPANLAWTPSTYYVYTAQSAAWTKANVINLAGAGK